MTPTYGDYLQLDGYSAIANVSDPASSGGSPNPFFITSDNFSSISDYNPTPQYSIAILTLH
jgi:membrane-bound lytic murein transglycosylase B